MTTIVPTNNYQYFQKPLPVWLGSVRFYLSRTGKSVVLVYTSGKVEGLLTPPKSARFYIPIEKWNSNKTEHIINFYSHSPACQRLRIFWYGQQLVSDARKSGLPKEVLSHIQHLLDRAYGQGWVYLNQEAQTQARIMIEQEKEKICFV